MTDQEINKLARIIEQTVRDVVADMLPNLRDENTKRIGNARRDLKDHLKALFGGVAAADAVPVESAPEPMPEKGGLVT